METITRKCIVEKIDKLLNKELTIEEFGEQMFLYLSLDDNYIFEIGYEKLIEDVLEEFSQMHDFGKENLGYVPDIPTIERLKEIKSILEHD